jgi:hypothetical protein
MSAAIGNSNTNTDTVGSFVDVRDFGAKPVEGFDNSPAFQAALDYLATRGGGTVYVPASNEPPNAYVLKKPVYFNGNNLKVKGDGNHSTYIQTWGPAFIVNKHPRYWTSRKSSYVDTDTGATVQTRNANNEFILDGRYRSDLFRYRPQGDIGSGESGVPPLDFPIDYPTTYYGLRTRGIVKGTFMGCSLATGNTSPGPGNTLDGWECHKQATFNFAYFAHDGKINGGIAGTGEVDKPDPWLFFGNGEDLYFSLAVTNDTLIDKGLVWVKFAQPSTRGLHRVSVQVDFVNKRFTVFVDRVQVAHTLMFPEFNGYQTLNATNLFNAFDKFARWETSDFAIGSMTRTAGRNDVGGANLSDYTIVGVAAYTKLQFVHGSAGQAQTRLDGLTLTDANTSMPSWENIQNSLGCVEMVESTGADLVCYARRGGQCYGMAVPDGTNGSGGPDAIANPAITDLSIVGYSTYSYSDAITLGVYLHAEIKNVTVKWGFYNSIGCLDLYVSYATFISDCELYSAGAPLFLVNQSWVIARNIRFGYIGRCAVRTAGSCIYLHGGTTNDFEAFAEGFLMAFAGKSIGAGHRFEDIMINLEGLRLAPRVAHFYIQKCFYHGNNKLILRNMTLGATSSIPAIYLDDPVIVEWSNYPAEVLIESSGLPADGPLVRVRGKDWRGTIDVARANCFDDVIQIVPSTYDFISTKTIHRDFYSTPNLGGWTKDNHHIVMPHPTEGGVSLWGCKTGGREGTANPPVWAPFEFRPTSRKHSLSGNIRSTMYMSASASHPAMTSPVNLSLTVIRDSMAETLLRRILNGSGTVDRGNVSFAYGIMIPYTNSENLDWLFSQSATLVNDSSLWNAAVNGSKTNKVPIAFTGTIGDDINSIVTRRAGFVCKLGNGSLSSFFLGKTDFAPREFYKNSNLTIPVNGMTVGNSNREGSWSRLMQNRISDWLFGYPSQSFPTTFHIGLSRTPINADGSGLTEISGGNYARVQVPLNASNFKKLGEYGTTWCNSQAVQFNAPSADWGDCEWFFIADAPTGGAVLASGPLNRPATIKSGDTAPVFFPESLHIQI